MPQKSQTLFCGILLYLFLLEILLICFGSCFVLRSPAYLSYPATVFSADGVPAEFSITPYLVNDAEEAKMLSFARSGADFALFIFRQDAPL